MLLDIIFFCIPIHLKYMYMKLMSPPPQEVTHIPPWFPFYVLLKWECLGMSPLNTVELLPTRQELPGAPTPSHRNSAVQGLSLQCPTSAPGWRTCPRLEELSQGHLCAQGLGLLQDLLPVPTALSSRSLSREPWYSGKFIHSHPGEATLTNRFVNILFSSE